MTLVSESNKGNISILLKRYSRAPLTVNLANMKGTRISKIAFNSSVELVLHDTNLLTVESHPFHLHGCNFFVVGSGIGNFDPKKDTSNYNLVDPPKRNTVGVPAGQPTVGSRSVDNKATAGQNPTTDDRARPTVGELKNQIPDFNLQLGNSKDELERHSRVRLSQNKNIFFSPTPRSYIVRNMIKEYQWEGREKEKNNTTG
ncbi:hypothetical protein M9H77_17331 [Catharanthus roseus]|uniref:Uncharacterized protein n=1 Tax=Catharanthus roseus TaxID=4058 RepID=A0ACC0B4P1_CATRO|nr:hypothetical protein M9H77_17331 [Catharanthus roseus]